MSNYVKQTSGFSRSCLAVCWFARDHSARSIMSGHEDAHDEARRKALEIAQKLSAMRGGGGAAPPPPAGNILNIQQMRCCECCVIMCCIVCLYSAVDAGQAHARWRFVVRPASR
jgi:hypothetical protein